MMFNTLNRNMCIKSDSSTRYAETVKDKVGRIQTQLYVNALKNFSDFRINERGAANRALKEC